MSHILIRFLISIFILNISYSIDFNTWTENSKDIIFNSKSIVKISFDAKIIINGTEVLPNRGKEDSYLILDEMVSHVSSILDKLDLPYRILKLCGGDLGFSASLTYDFEVYSAGQERWLEVSSVSNFESYQSNRLKLRYKDEQGKNRLCHTLNGSALALPRIFAAIIENNQTESGINIPKFLQSYTGFDIID